MQMKRINIEIRKKVQEKIKGRIRGKTVPPRIHHIEAWIFVRSC
jgi:hypothetical protein